MARKKSQSAIDVKIARFEARAAKKNAERIYKEKIKEMRPYLKSLKKIDLRSKLNSSQKGLITKAWNEYQELTARPVKIFRTKNKHHLNIAQNYARHERGKIKFDVAFIPTADQKAKLIFKNDRLIMKSKYVTETTLFFDLKKLAENPEQEINDTLARNKDAKQFIIMAGKYLYNGGLARSLVGPEVMMMMQRYSAGGDGLKRRGENSHYSNWLFGLIAFESANQKSINDYRLAYRDAKNSKLSKRKNTKRQRGYKYGEKF